MSNGEYVNTITGEIAEVTADDVGLGEIVESPAVNETSDKAIVISAFREVVASVMSEAQFAILSGRTPRNVIRKRPGKGQKTFSYVPHGYVTTVLNKAFGFHWDFEVLPNGRGDLWELVQGIETVSNGKTVKTPTSVCVSGRLTVYVHDPNDMSKVIAVIRKDSTGEKEFVPGMTWGALRKAAESDAFKRCAARLGIANDLYYNDSDDDAIMDAPSESAASIALTAKVRELKASGKPLSVIANELGISVPDVAKRLK